MACDGRRVVTETDNILEIGTGMKTPHVNLSIKEDSLVRQPEAWQSTMALECDFYSNAIVNTLLRVAMRTLERLPGPESPGGAQAPSITY
jgi:hypothetical protein